MAPRQKKIVAVDDSTVFLMYISILLKRMGFEVVPVESGAEALRVVRLVEPDLVMLDVVMPGMDGIKVLTQLKRDQQAAGIPVIMMSVLVEEESVEKCRGLGAAGYLKKPIQIELLHDLLQDCIFSPMGWKRKHVRAALNAKVTVRSGGADRELHAESISAGGIYLRTNKPFPAGTDLELTVPVNEGRKFVVKGTVAYVKGLYGDVFKVPPGMAVEFRELTEEMASELNSYAKRLLAGDIAEFQEESVISLEEEPA
jgi:CheY-like chemotaxis protein